MSAGGAEGRRGLLHLRRGRADPRADRARAGRGGGRRAGPAVGRDLRLGAGVRPRGRSARRAWYRRYLASFYLPLPHYRQLFAANGFPEAAEEVGRRLAAGDVDGAAAAIPNEAVDEIALAGTPAECVERLPAFFERGLDAAKLYPVPIEDDWAAAYADRSTCSRRVRLRRKMSTEAPAVDGGGNGVVQATRLTQYFHPVARSNEVGERLATFRLMDQDVVVYRNAEGRAVAFKDLCIHRGSRLSLGEVTPTATCGARITAGSTHPTARASGSPRCRPTRRSPPRRGRSPMRSRSVRHGVGRSRRAGRTCSLLPERRVGRPGMAGLPDGGPAMDAAAGRILENFCDRSHVPWVHPAMASRDRPRSSRTTSGSATGSSATRSGGATTPGARSRDAAFTAPSGREKNEFVVTLPFTRTCGRCSARTARPRS